MILWHRRTFARGLADFVNHVLRKQAWGVSVQRCVTRIFTSNRVDERTYQSSKEYSPAISKDKNPKASHLKCMYTNACSLGNKQEETELRAQSEICVVIGTTEMWWENSHDWKTTMDGYKLFQKDRKGRRGVGILLYVK